MSVQDTNAGEPLAKLLAGLRRADNRRLKTAFARVLNNHLYVKATFNPGNGELNSQDVDLILDGFDLVLRTIAPSEAGHVAYAPKTNGSGNVARQGDELATSLTRLAGSHTSQPADPQ